MPEGGPLGPSGNVTGAATGWVRAATNAGGARSVGTRRSGEAASGASGASGTTTHAVAAPCGDVRATPVVLCFFGQGRSPHEVVTPVSDVHTTSPASAGSATSGTSKAARTRAARAVRGDDDLTGPSYAVVPSLLPAVREVTQRDLAAEGTVHDGYVHQDV